MYQKLQQSTWFYNPWLGTSVLGFIICIKKAWFPLALTQNWVIHKVSHSREFWHQPKPTPHSLEDFYGQLKTNA
jgi:hypothetical protein